MMYYILNSFRLTGKLLMRIVLSLLMKIINLLDAICYLIVSLISKILSIFFVLIIISLFISKEFRNLIFDGVWWHTLVWVTPVLLIKPTCLFIDEVIAKLLDNAYDKLDEMKFKTYF